MIGLESINTRYRSHLAAAVRRVNAEHDAAGRPDLPALNDCWVDLMTQMQVARSAGDDVVELRAIRTWEARAIDLIRGSR